jgi:tape measure domain-containing protein
MVSMGGFAGGMAGGATVSIIINAIDNYSKEFNNAEAKVGSINKTMLGAGAALTGFGLAGASALSVVVKEAGNLEQTTTAFKTFLGSEEAAVAKLKELTDFAAKTPFTLPGVEASARQLLAVGFEADDLIPVLKSVGDVSSGLGLGEAGLQRLILNLGQVKAQGKLTGRELMDFSRAGVPMIKALADKFGIAESAVADMVSAGEVGFEDVIEAFEGMSGEGGQFFNLMEAQSKTFLGQASNIEDSLIKIARVMGEMLLPAVKWVADKLQILVSWFEEHPKVAQFAVVVGALAVALALIVGPILMIIAILPAISAGIGILTGAFGALSLSMLPVTLTILGIAAAIAAVIFIIKRWSEIMKFMETVLEIGGKYMEFYKNTMLISWEQIKKGVGMVVNFIIDGLERAMNKVINFANTLIAAYNAVASKLDKGTIDPLDNVDFSKAKMNIDAIDSRISELRENNKQLVTEMGDLGVQAWEDFKDIFTGADAVSPDMAAEPIASDVAGNLTSDVNVNIDNVNGMDPDDLSRALKENLQDIVTT